MPTMTDLLNYTSKDPFVLRAARSLIGRVSGRGESSPGHHDPTMGVA